MKCGCHCMVNKVVQDAMRALIVKFAGCLYICRHNFDRLQPITKILLQRLWLRHIKFSMNGSSHAIQICLHFVGDLILWNIKDTWAYFMQWSRFVKHAVNVWHRGNFLLSKYFAREDTTSLCIHVNRFTTIHQWVQLLFHQ